MKSKFYAVEILIFSGVCLVFMNSVYNLFTDGKLLSDGSRTPIAIRSLSTPEGERRPAPAGAMANFIPYETKCAPTGEVFETTAAKVRILGPFCGAPAQAVRQIASEEGATSHSGPSEYRIENTTSHYLATVFSDLEAAKFSTDFVPLESGPNKIHMEFRYKDGHIFPVELTIIKK